MIFRFVNIKLNIFIPFFIFKFSILELRKKQLFKFFKFFARFIIKFLYIRCVNFYIYLILFSIFDITKQ